MGTLGAFVAGASVVLFILGVVAVISSVVGGVIHLRKPWVMIPLSERWHHFLLGGGAMCVVGVLLFYNPWLRVPGGVEVTISGGIGDHPFKVTLKPTIELTDVSGKVTLYYSNGAQRDQSFLFASWKYNEEKVNVFKGARRDGFEKIEVRMVGTNPRVGTRMDFTVDALKTDFTPVN